MRFKGKTAIVVGAGRGIGRSVALVLATEGAQLVLVDPGGARDGRADGSNPAEDVAQEVRALGATAVVVTASATDYAASGKVVADAVAQFGRLDVLVNSAGVLRERMIWNMPEEDWDVVLQVHLKTVYNMCHHASRVMRKQRYGRIVNMTSEAWKGTMGQANYGAAKGAIWSFTRSIARELGRYGVTCNTIAPSAATRLTVTDDVKAGFKKRLDAGLITRERYEQVINPPGPEFIAPLVAWLCSDAAADVNGQNFRCLKGKIATYMEPLERSALLKTDNDGMFTLDDLDQNFMTTLMAGVINPAPRQEEEAAVKTGEQAAR